MACAVATPVLEPSGDFPAWLEAQGVNAEVAQAMDSELGIRDYGVLRACIEDGLVRAELLATARDRLPFGFYAVLRQVVKALQGAEPRNGGTTPHWDDAASGNMTLGGLVNVLLTLFSGFSRELLLSVQRLEVMDSAGSCTELSSPPANDGSPEIAMNVDQDHLSECDIPYTESAFSSNHMTHRIKVEACDGRQVPEEDFGITIQAETSLHSEQGSLISAAEPALPSSLQLEAAAKVKIEGVDAVTEWALSEGRSACESTVSLNVEKQLNGKQRSEPGEMRHHCDQCGRSFSQIVTLKRHQCQTTRNYRDIGHHSKMHTNDKCRLRKPDDKSITQDPQEECHMIDYTREGPHQYGIGNEGCTDAFQLKDFECIHTNKTLHPCDICQQVFLWADHLKAHRRLHMREKYKCKMCGQAFSRSTTLKRHQMVHTGERPYKCEVCGKAFAQRTNCQRHQSQHFKEKS